MMIRSVSTKMMRRLASSRRFMSTRTAAMAMAMDNGAILNQPRMAASAAGGRLDNVVYAKTVRCFSSEEPVTMKVPAMGDSITEGTIAEWLKNPGDWVDQDEELVSIETDKVTVDVRAEIGGFVQEQLAQKDETVNVGSDLVVIKPGEKPADAGKPAEPPKEQQQEAQPKKQAQQQQQQQQAPASQAKETPKAASAPQQQSALSSAPIVSEKPVDPEKYITGSRTEKRVQMSRMRKMIAQRLKDAQNTNAMLTTFQEVDMTNLMDMRKKHKDEFEKKHGVKLGFMSAFIKASAATLNEIPAINAVIDGGDIVFRDYIDVSVAVSSPRGLVVPVLRNVESQSFAEIEKNLNELATKARENKIAMEDMAGGTFTVSNGGVFGSMMGTPIINPPQSAILGMHATKMRPTVVDGKVEPRPIMYLALTYDHRLIDGREAATFLVNVREKIQDPHRLLLEL